MAATPDEVQNAIDKAEHYLYAQQRTGSWERKKSKKSVAHISDQPGGTTVTAVYALLSAGERPDNPKIAAAIQYLKGTDFTGVYTLGMRCQVWRMLLPDDEIKAALRRDGQLLEKSISSDTGMYDVGPRQPSQSTESHRQLLRNPRRLGLCAGGNGDPNRLLAGR